MNVKKAISLFRSHQGMNQKKRTIKSYKNLLFRFETMFSNCLIESIGADEIYRFLENITGHLAKSTRRLRYAQIKYFYSFIIDQLDLNIKNSCNSSLLTKSFRIPPKKERKILSKETMDEVIYKTKSQRDRLILELQARCGLRIGELLRLKESDISDRKLIIREPKSGRDTEIAFMPEQIAKRLNEYVKNINLSEDDRLFPICYSTARTLIKKLGEKLQVSLSPHDLRRHSATYASRNGVPLEIISKVILRHQDLKTTQIYLGKVSEIEAIRWMDILHGK
jgi:integrase